MNNDEIKATTLALYDLLPDNYDERTMLGPDGKVHPELYPEIRDIRDKIIEVNYRFFGYVASNSYIKNGYITYEDKFQSCVLHFTECWWKYRWKGDANHRGYRQDLSFGVFFKPRISEMMERELSEVRYSIERSVKMKAGEQLGKHWNQVTYEDLPQVDLPVDVMNSLKAVLGALYPEDISEFEWYAYDNPDVPSVVEKYCKDTNYQSISRLLLYEMIIQEKKLGDSELQEISEIYGIPVSELSKNLPKAEGELHEMLKEYLNLSDCMT